MSRQFTRNDAITFAELLVGERPTSNAGEDGEPTIPVSAEVQSFIQGAIGVDNMFSPAWLAVSNAAYRERIRPLGVFLKQMGELLIEQSEQP